LAVTDVDLDLVCRTFYEPRVAIKEEDAALAFAMRFQVYCREAAYFPAEHYPDALELDGYDERSAQSVLVYRPSNACIGAVRVILPHEQPELLDRFPFDAICGDLALSEIKDLPAVSTAEVSRLCVSRQITGEIARTDPRLLQDLKSTEGDDVARELARMAKLPLLRSVVEMCITHSITHVCAVMEPFLLRSLAKLGVHFINVGDTVQYHGERQPCYAELASLLSIAREERPDVWNVLTDRGRLVP
jgi:N-acyl amino acid synthase of PEP-CTERM/exosortase system